MSCGIVAGFYYRPLDMVLLLFSVVIGLTADAIINRTADDVKWAKRIRDPVPPDKVLSFSLEDERKRDENKIVAFTLEKNTKEAKE